MSVKFKHLRFYNTHFTNLYTSNPHKGVGSIAGCGGVTVAYNEDGGIVRYSLSRCSIEDTYNKKHGRNRASGFLNQSGDKVKNFVGTLSEFHNFITTAWVSGKTL
jgi:hypothetical protein